MNASILWFNTGFIEYRLPNYLEKDDNILELQLTMEISSEAPGVAENWPSDISFYFNNHFIGNGLALVIMVKINVVSIRLNGGKIIGINMVY